MAQWIKRDYATSLTAMGFLIVGISGVMMYFHWLDSFVKEMHEILGLVFVGAVVLHLVANWGAMKNYFSKPLFRLIGAVAIAVVIGFVATADGGLSPKGKVIEAVLKAPVEQSFLLLGGDLERSRQKLTAKGIKIEGSTSIDEIAKANHKSPFEIVEILQK